jgi:D-xylose 1-dehydrogenase (NADP+, D-xylono-1,5-lactone-forming)
MAEKALNWGFLSTAKINQRVMPAFRDSKRNRLYAVASRDQETAESYASQWKIPKAFGSYEDMLAAPEIDVVYNPLPNHLHTKWNIKAMQAGKHVLCEKPFALTVEDIDLVENIANDTGKIIAEAFMYRHHPQTLKVKQMVDDGILGKVKLIRGSFTYQFTRQGNYRADPAMGGGALWDIGCYPLSYARAVLGLEPVEVFGWQVIGVSSVDDSFIAQMRFPGEVHAQFDCSFTIPQHTFMELVGDEGTLIIPVPFTPQSKEYLFLTRGDKTEKITVKAPGLYHGEVEDMADAILLGKPPRISLADTRANTLAILALFESAKTGNPVTL